MANVKPIGPHKVLTDAIAELEQLRQRVAELEVERDKATQYWQMLKQQRDELSRLCEFNEKTMGKLLKQRDELLAALEYATTRLDDPVDTRLIGEAIASVKGKQNAD